jgi:hypothetical protein
MRQSARSLASAVGDRQVRGAHGEDRPLGRGLVAEPLQVGLAERAFPRERFATDGPGPVTVAVFVFALRDLGQCAGHPSYVVERRHPSTVLPCLAGTRHGSRVRWVEPRPAVPLDG